MIRSADSTAQPAKGWIRRMVPWLRPHRRNASIAFGAAVVGSAIAAVVPAVERQIIDNVIIAHTQPLAPWLTILIVLAFATFGAAYLRRFVGGRVSLDVQYDLRNAIYDQLQRLDFARHDELQTGQLVSRANSDVGLLQGLLSFLPIMTGNIVLIVVVNRHHVRAVAAAGAGLALRRSQPHLDGLPHAQPHLPRQLGCAATRG